MYIHFQDMVVYGVVTLRSVVSVLVNIYLHKGSILFSHGRLRKVIALHLLLYHKDFSFEGVKLSETSLPECHLCSPY